MNAKDVLTTLLSACSAKIMAFVGRTPLPRRERESAPSTRSQALLAASGPTATIGPCVNCQCDRVIVTLLTSQVRYCRCPQCGVSWTEPAKWRNAGREEPAWYSPEALKFPYDRN